MQQAVAPCPEIIMSIKGKPTRSLLDSGSEVTLVFNLCWRNKYELHVWTMDVYSSRSDRYDATSRLSRVTKGDMIA